MGLDDRYTKSDVQGTFSVTYSTVNRLFTSTQGAGSHPLILPPQFSSFAVSYTGASRGDALRMKVEVDSTSAPLSEKLVIADIKVSTDSIATAFQGLFQDLLSIESSVQ